MKPARSFGRGYTSLLSFLAYYVLRPIRDELGVTGGVSNLPWLFTGTLLALLAVDPLFAYVVRRWPRERFISITYRFFILNLLVFMALLSSAESQQHIWIGRAFFIWVSVFNLFVVSVFWSFIVDVFDGEQGKRLWAPSSNGTKRSAALRQLPREDGAAAIRPVGPLLEP